VFPLDEDVINFSLSRDLEADNLFRVGWRDGLHRLSRRDRARVATVTGHVAESITEVVLEPLGWIPLWHFKGPGGHGIDLLFLAPSDLVVALEVKGTLIAGRIPLLSQRELTQMSADWINKADNPGMTEPGLGSGDIYGGVVVVNIADLSWRIALTQDFSQFQPVVEIDRLHDLDWLQVRAGDRSTLS
jgi:hypothetical protein